MMLHVATDDGHHGCHHPPPVSPQMPYILPMITSSKTVPMLSYGFSFEAWTLFPDKQQMTRDLNHISFLHCNPGLYPDINARIVTYCKRIENPLQTADKTIMPVDVQAIIAVHNGYLWDYANAAVLRVTKQATTLNSMPLMLPTPMLTP